MTGSFGLGSTGTAPLTTAQKKVIVAAFLGWTLDAFDFFLLVFALPSIAASFAVSVPTVAYAIFLTLAMRVVGAFVFGRLGDRYGRRPVLMLDIVCYSVLGAAAAFAPSLTVFLVLRALFGAAMGGEWGLGAALTMESVPPSWRGRVSGMLQCGYPVGYLLAAISSVCCRQRWCCTSAVTSANRRRSSRRDAHRGRRRWPRFARTGAWRCMPSS
jgi:SHS family lactate transporter-like MFS transporter